MDVGFPQTFQPIAGVSRCMGAFEQPYK